MKKITREKISNRFSRSVKGIIHPFLSQKESTPVFILGYGRSGTSMLFRIFERDPRIQAFGENHPAVAQRYMLCYNRMEKTIKNSGFTVVALKPILNSFDASKILSLYPNGIFIWLIRDYHDVVASSLKKFGPQVASYLKNYIEHGKTGNWISKGMPCATREKIAAIAKHNQLNTEDWMSLVWWGVNYTIIQEHLHTLKNVIILRYENFVAAPEHEIKKIYRNIGLSYKTTPTKFVHQKSVGKGSKLTLNKAVDQICSDLENQINKIAKKPFDSQRPACTGKENESPTKRKKICYFKAGDVTKELSASITSQGEITGGPNYYIYDTREKFKNEAQIRYLSFGEKDFVVNDTNCSAETIKTSVIGKYSGLQVLKLATQIVKSRPDHVIAVRRRWLHLIYLAAKSVGSTFSMSVHTDIVKTKIDYATTKHLVKISDSVICHGPYLKTELLKISNNKSKIIEYNASSKDFDRLQAHLPPETENYKNKKLIVFIGRMEKRKGVYDLYNAAKRLLKENPTLALCFAGGGQAVKPIRQLACSDRLSSQVLVLNKISRAQVASLLRLAWVVVTPTKNSFPEGRCMAAMEALTMGVPVIAPAFGPFPFLIKNGRNGLLYTPDSIDDLQRTLLVSLNPQTHEKLVERAKSGAALLQSSNLSYGEAVKKAIYQGQQNHATK